MHVSSSFKSRYLVLYIRMYMYMSCTYFMYIIIGAYACKGRLV